LNVFLQKSKQSYVNPSQLALVYFTLGEKDKGFTWLYKAYEERDSWLREIKTVKGFDNVRSDPRFKELLRKIGLEK
ncbi:MAG: hypothetical protein OEV55_10435, partial [candidate division Zixibacteria bacterium]|nr:hypothetical protein [candidate division Zixibacteria bacterium]